jgi:hypothetical protein
MKIKNSFIRFIDCILFTILTINSFAQVVERNGIMYRDFQFNDDTMKSNLISKNESGFALADTIRLPFVKDDFIVNNFEGEYGADQTNVSAAMDGNGNYAFTWVDYRNGQKEIYAQFYNVNDEKAGNNFKVNEEILEGNNSPFIATNINGDFVIVWLRDFQNVMAQRYTKDGQKVGNNILVNISSGWNTSEPSVAVSNNGSFMVMWSSNLYSGNSLVHARVFDSSGNPVSSDILVNDTSFSSSSSGRGRTVAVDQSGKFYLTWSSSSTTGFSKIYLQVIDGYGNKVGSNVSVSNLNDISRNYFPDIASTDDGNFLITWEKAFDFPGTNGGVSGRIYKVDGSFVTDEFLIYSDPSASWNPTNVSSDGDSIFIVFWLGSNGQYLQRIKSNGDFIGDTVKVRYNSDLSGYVYYSGLTDLFDNHFFIAPEFYERKDQNIYIQKFDIDLQPTGSFDKLHDDFGSAWQKKPFVKFNNFGESIILWEDWRNGRYDLYAQVYDENYNPIGNNLQINEIDDDYWFLESKSAECLSDGTFIIAFSGGEEYNNRGNVLLQKVSKAGEKIGLNKLVKGGNYYYDYNVALNVSTFDEILICWYNRYGVDMRVYDNNLVAISGEKTLLEYTSTTNFDPITVSIDTSFNILTVWTNYDYQNSSTDNRIRGKFFDKEGNGFKDFVIDSISSYVADYTCKNDGHNYALLFRDDNRIYLKRFYNLEQNYSFKNIFNSYGYYPDQMNIVEFSNQKVFVTYNSYMDVIGFYANDNRRETETYLLHQYDHIDPYYDNYNGSNSSDILNDKIIFSYESNSNEGTGNDIWANVRKIESVNFESELFYPPADYDVLYNNFPNPFNSKTRIAYELLAYHKVNLTIYDILGREVKVLVNENQEKGLYEVQFDGSSLSSGVYFYKLEAFKTTAKKMILLK